MPGPHGGNRKGSSKRGLSRVGVQLSKARPFPEDPNGTSPGDAITARSPGERTWIHAPSGCVERASDHDTLRLAMAVTLNPRLDVVFKLLFADERNGDLLVALLNAVLRPSRPIASVEVVNPEIQKDAPDDRGLVLDILAVHDDDTRTDVEMQCDDRGATEQRALFHWARVYRDGLNRGDAFRELYPVRVVFILGYAHLPGTRVHSIFQLREVHDGTQLSDDLEIHMVELPKLASGAEVDAEDKAAYEWARFLAAETDEERRRVAMGNEDIRKATEALDQLSQDPKAQRLARWREDQMRMYRVELAATERRGLERGLQRGLERGLERERTLVRRLLDKKFGPLDAAALARLEAADHAALERYADRVLTAKSLAEVFDG